MAFVGSAALIAGLITALYASGAALAGARSGRRELVVSARRAIYCLAALMVLCVVVLEAAYLRSDFSFALVAGNSSTDTPLFYRMSAMWASQAGSLLLWALVLSCFSSAVLRATRRTLVEIVPYATAVLGVVAAFFVAMMIFYASPFATLAHPPAQGNGLTPLLRFPVMMIHPPMLYTGYVGFSIPFAFAIGALITRNVGAEWIRATRRYTLIAWTFLGFGILLGALWSYSELGWGGYWAWDPVENASLMPWLVGTAFLHSSMVQEKRGMLRVWNVSLVIAAFLLALVGTFLVRSGILQSIHAFGASTLGVPFIAFIAVVLFGSGALVLARRDVLRSSARLDSLLSREAFFLFNNLALVAMCFVIFWGTFFPLIHEAVTGNKASVGPPWFDRYTVPLAILLVLLTALGPMLAWRRVNRRQLARAFGRPLLATALTLLVLLTLSPAADDPRSLVLFCFGALSLAVAFQEVARGVRARRIATGEAWPRAVVRLVARNRRRYGGYIVHAGIVLAFVGVAASSAFSSQRDLRLSPGQSARVGAYSFSYRQPTVSVLHDPSHSGAPLSFGALVDVRRGSEHLVLRPSRNLYPSVNPADGPVGHWFSGESVSAVGIKWGLQRDLWTAVQPDFSGLQKLIAVANVRFATAPERVQGLVTTVIAMSYLKHAPPANFRIIVFPMVSWIWLGGALALFGALIALWPSRLLRERRARSTYKARLGRELAHEQA
jgi:cytochrome c-type biogenesis protein CcmF